METQIQANTAQVAVQAPVQIESSQEDEPPGCRPYSIVTLDKISVSKPAPRAPKRIDWKVISPAALEFKRKFFPKATRREWNDWQWQIRHSITSLQQLQPMMQLSAEELQPISNHSLPTRITPYYGSLLSVDDPNQGLRRSIIPTADELRVSAGEAADPLGEEHDSPVPCVVHRYPDRVLFLVTGFCSTYCRYCTRSRMVGNDDHHVKTSEWLAGIEYIRSKPQIRDVLISGGDALTLSDDRLEFLLSRLRQIPHVEFIRIGTKVPVVLPQRITKSLTKVLKKYHPLWMSLHFTHPDEITPEVAEACARLADAGIPLGSQTVLLRGINDEVPIMKDLVHGLLKIRVRPYYLYQCDPVLGTAHFRTPVEKGLEIIRGLRGFTTGYGVPHYVIDAPNGGGKIPLLPEYYVGRDGDNVVLKNYEGKTFTYPDTV
jgi:lysine 2,3-aminomutase